MASFVAVQGPRSAQMPQTLFGTNEFRQKPGLALFQAFETLLSPALFEYSFQEAVLHLTAAVEVHRTRIKNLRYAVD